MAVLKILEKYHGLHGLMAVLKILEKYHGLHGLMAVLKILEKYHGLHVYSPCFFPKIGSEINPNFYYIS